MQTVYILHSSARERYYIGFTSDLARRLDEHRAGRNRSTCGASDWKLVFSRRVCDAKSARALEKTIKARGAMRYLAAPAPAEEAGQASKFTPL